MRQALVETSFSRGVRGIASPATMFWQRQFDRFVARMRTHAIPARVRLWNGLEAVLGDERMSHAEQQQDARPHTASTNRRNAATGSRAAMIGRPTTRCVAPRRTASSALTVRA